MNLARVQHGFTLVELMVSLGVSLFLVAGMFHILDMSRLGARVHGELNGAQESGRFALEIFGRELRKAGYSFAPLPDDFPCASPVFPTQGQVVTGTDPVPESPDPTLRNSTITLRYRGSGTGAGDGRVQDCLGSPLSQADVARVTLLISGTDLRCTVTVGGAPARTQPLVSGIESMLLTYGVDTTSDGYADQYVAAASVGDWRDVVGVGVQLRFVTEDRSSEALQPYLGFVSAADDLSESPQPRAMLTPADHRLRRVYSSTVTLRNPTLRKKPCE